MLSCFSRFALNAQVALTRQCPVPLRYQKLVDWNLDEILAHVDGGRCPGLVE